MSRGSPLPHQITSAGPCGVPDVFVAKEHKFFVFFISNLLVVVSWCSFNRIIKVYFLVSISKIFTILDAVTLHVWREDDEVKLSSACLCWQVLKELCSFFFGCTIKFFYMFLFIKTYFESPRTCSQRANKKSFFRNWFCAVAALFTKCNLWIVKVLV